MTQIICAFSFIYVNTHYGKTYYMARAKENHDIFPLEKKKIYRYTFSKQNLCISQASRNMSKGLRMRSSVKGFAKYPRIARTYIY